ncbi:hypothetical protein HJC99_02655 [Candidatus Saccharibacteria bacterium]|nr:hypothetical protein [Candidatus Saccharibacteria bacterium]
MFTWSHFFLGLFFVAVGTVLLKYNYSLVGYTGRQDWIERYAGYGSTYLIYQVFAIILTLAGLLLATGLGTPVLDWVLSPLRGVFQSFHK